MELRIVVNRTALIRVRHWGNEIIENLTFPLKWIGSNWDYRPLIGAEPTNSNRRYRIVVDVDTWRWVGGGGITDWRMDVRSVGRFAWPKKKEEENDDLT